MVSAPHRSWIAVLSLFASLTGCAPASPEATAPITTVTAPTSAATVSTAPPAAADASASASPAATPVASSSPPPVDARAARERTEAVLRCRKQRCANLGKACFDNCYRHGHLSDPEGHTRCDESCRAAHGVEQCEAACEQRAATKRDR